MAFAPVLNLLECTSLSSSMMTRRRTYGSAADSHRNPQPSSPRDVATCKASLPVCPMSALCPMFALCLSYVCPMFALCLPYVCPMFALCLSYGLSLLPSLPPKPACLSVAASSTHRHRLGRRQLSRRNRTTSGHAARCARQYLRFSPFSGTPNVKQLSKPRQNGRTGSIRCAMEIPSAFQRSVN